MNHQLCPCGKKVGHGRHFPGPRYRCECGFESSRIADLKKHLRQVGRELNQIDLLRHR